MQRWTVVALGAAPFGFAFRCCTCRRFSAVRRRTSGAAVFAGPSSEAGASFNVNGPGESKHADIGISLPGTGESPAAPVFIDGAKAVTLRGARIAEEFQALVEDYVERRFGGERKSA
jgi:hypothetical protein